jgi:dTDP-4-amino-4,6-dideoxygalactose transaminase
MASKGRIGKDSRLQSERYQSIAFPEVTKGGKRALKLIADSLKDRNLSNFGLLTQQAEKELIRTMECKYCFTFPNGTTALTAALIAVIGEKKGYVVCPSFTFIASAISIEQAGYLPAFADIDRKTLTIDPLSVERTLKTTKNVKAVMGAHMFGNPCDIKHLTELCNSYEVPLVFDSAHAFGASYENRKIGNFGSCEAFSTSSTKVLTSAEGGFVTTNIEDIANSLQIIRNYGIDRKSGKIVTRGLNGKMSELQAALLLDSIPQVSHIIRERTRIALQYQKTLSAVAGLSFQELQPRSKRTYKDFPIIIDSAIYGHSRNALMNILERERIETRAYFDQLIHEVERFSDCPRDKTGITNSDDISRNILCLPIYSALSKFDVDRIIKIIVQNKHKKEVLNIENQ